MERPLTPKQRMAAELLGGGMTRREAAERVGVHENTVSNWLRLGAFRTARDEAVDALVLEMRPKAWDVFARQLEDEDKKIAQQAASQVLKMAEGQDKALEKTVSVRFLYMPRPGEVADEQGGTH